MNIDEWVGPCYWLFWTHFHSYTLCEVAQDFVARSCSVFGLTTYTCYDVSSVTVCVYLEQLWSAGSDDKSASEAPQSSWGRSGQPAPGQAGQVTDSWIWLCQHQTFPSSHWRWPAYLQAKVHFTIGTLNTAYSSYSAPQRNSVQLCTVPMFLGLHRKSSNYHIMVWGTIETCSLLTDKDTAVALYLFMLHDDVIHKCCMTCSTFYPLILALSLALSLSPSTSPPLPSPCPVLHLRTNEGDQWWTWRPYPACPPTPTSLGTPPHAAPMHTALAADLPLPLVSSTLSRAEPVPPSRQPSEEGSSRDSFPIGSAREIGK